MRSNTARPPIAPANIRRRDDCQTTISALFSFAARLPTGELPNTRPIGGLQLSLNRRYGWEGEEPSGDNSRGTVRMVSQVNPATHDCCDSSHTNYVVFFARSADVLELTHSSRSATSGSTVAARRAGSRLAAAPTSASDSATPPRISGSRGATPYNSFVSTCVTASVSTSPRKVPATAIRSP